MILSGYNIQLKSIQIEDLEMIRQWRNSPEVKQFMLNQETISSAQQLVWFNKISKDQSQLHFVIYYKDKPIGSANIRSIEPRKSLVETSIIEPGLYIADQKYRGNIVAFAPTLLLNDYCFNTLKVDKLVAVVKQTNQEALNYNYKLGYQIEKEGDLIEIGLNFDDYQSHSKIIKRLLSR